MTTRTSANSFLINGPTAGSDKVFVVKAEVSAKLESELEAALIRIKELQTELVYARLGASSIRKDNPPPKDANEFLNRMADEIQQKQFNHDPKGAAGKLKPQMQLLSPQFLTALAKVMEGGAERYGAWNFRLNQVTDQTYVAAILRHLMAYQQGEDADIDSKQSHLAHIGACVMIMLDAKEHGTLIDNRPPKKP